MCYTEMKARARLKVGVDNRLRATRCACAARVGYQTYVHVPILFTCFRSNTPWRAEQDSSAKPEAGSCSCASLRRAAKGWTNVQALTAVGKQQGTQERCSGTWPLTGRIELHLWPTLTDGSATALQLQDSIFIQCILADLPTS
eukprot:jgi/Ulvmu1/3271/UM151_0019.1